MEIEKLLDAIPCCAFGNETLYNALEFEKQLHEQDAYFEVENVLVTPFYVDPGMRWRYEMYEYELNIVISDCESFENYAMKFFSTLNLEDVEKKYLDRLKQCYIGAKNNDNILIPLQHYIEFILHGKDIQADYQEYFGEYSAENVFIAVY